ncbi:MAG: hypothetical protein Q9195_000091 [Heterodermia aff. obscurata]
MDTTVQSPVTCNDKAWKRSRRLLRYPVSCSEHHPYLNPDPSMDPDRDIETTNVAAANPVPTSAHGKRKRSGKSQPKISKQSKSKCTKSTKNQNTDAQAEKPVSENSKGSKNLKSFEPSTSKRRRTSKHLRRMPGHDNPFDHERDFASMDTFGTLGGEMMAETYGYELAPRMDPAAWDYNFF